MIVRNYSRFRKQTNKAVITSGDRADIQLAALETSTTCLILTGNLRPSPLIVKQADEFDVAVLLVRSNTLETVEAVERRRLPGVFINIGEIEEPGTVGR